MTSLTWEELVARRARRNHLLERAPADRLADVASDVCGLQAQLLPAAELGVAARVAGVTRAEVRAALWERRSLVKAYSIRGTIHVHAAADVPLFFAAVRAVAWWREPAWLRARGLRLEQVDEVTNAARDALDGRALTYRELEAEIVKRIGAWAAAPVPERPFGQENWGVWRQLLSTQEGPICFGPNRGREVALVRADQWIAGWRDVDPDDALREVLRRYLRAYGPAMPAEFAHWFHMQPASVRRLVDSMADELAEVDVEGFRGWILAADAAARPPEPAASVRLLPDYDCYTIGSHPPGPQRKRLIPEESGTRVFGGGAGPFASLVIDGRVAGVWRRRASGRRLRVHVEPFGRIAAAVERQINVEAERIAAFLGSDAEVTLAR